MTFFVTVNETFEILLSSQNASDFCMLTLFPENFYVIDSSDLSVANLGFSMKTIKLSAGNGNVVPCFPMFVSNTTKQQISFKMV